MNNIESTFDQLLELRAQFVARATGGSSEDHRYVALRKALLANAKVAKLLPSFVRTSYSMGDFWTFIQPKYDNYRQRREFFHESFASALAAVDVSMQQPADNLTGAALERLESQTVCDHWTKALQRRQTDPDGAVTSARTLLESLCKQVLDEQMVEYGRDDDLPKLYGRVARLLQLDPSGHRDDGVKQALGGCFSLVQGLTTLRNARGDAHGQGEQKAMRAAPRHADLAVNVSGAVAVVLLATYEARAEKNELPHPRPLMAT